MTDQEIEKIVKKTTEFVSYVDSFYGPTGIYSMNATSPQICGAIQKMIDRRLENQQDIYFDSVDREAVRDILIEDYGLTFPN